MISGPSCSARLLFCDAPFSRFSPPAKAAPLGCKPRWSGLRAKRRGWHTCSLCPLLTDNLFGFRRYCVRGEVSGLLGFALDGFWPLWGLLGFALGVLLSGSQNHAPLLNFLILVLKQGHVIARDNPFRPFLSCLVVQAQSSSREINGGHYNYPYSWFVPKSPKTST